MNFLKKLFNNSSQNDNESNNAQPAIENFFEANHLIEISDVLSVKQPLFDTRYRGKVISSSGEESVLVFYLDSETDFTYEVNNNVSAIYSHNKDLFMVELRIDKIIELYDFKDNLDATHHLHKFTKDIKKLKYIEVVVSAVSSPERYQRREKYRINTDWPIFFKVLDDKPEWILTQISWSVDNIFEARGDGYFKMNTLDISEGGFKSRIQALIPAGTEIECIIDALNSNDKGVKSINVKGKILNCMQNPDNPSVFDTRVQFLDMTADNIDFMKKNMVILSNRAGYKIKQNMEKV